MAPRAKPKAEKAQAKKAEASRTKGSGKGKPTIGNSGVKKPAAKKHETRGSKVAAGKGAKVTEKKGVTPADKNGPKAPGKKDTKAPTKPDKKKESEAPEDFTEALEDLKQIHSDINHVANGACICVSGEGSVVTIKPKSLPRLKKSRTIKSVLAAIDSVKQAASHAAEQVQNCDRCQCLDDEVIGGIASNKGQDLDDEDELSSNGGAAGDEQGKGKKPESKGDFRYPTFEDTDLTPKSACKHWAMLKKYWSLHYATEAGNHRHIDDYSWIDPDAAIDAVNCVTEAITQNGNEQFALFTTTAYSNWKWRKDPDGFPRSTYRVGRRGSEKAPNRLLMPFWIRKNEVRGGKKSVWDLAFDTANHKEDDGHTILLEFFADDDGTLRASIYDSYTGYLLDALEEDLISAISHFAHRVGWGTVGKSKIEREPAVQQSGDATCTLHAILHGWAVALGLPLRKRKLTANFNYDEALYVVNLALAGYLDSAAIYAYLLCQKLVDVEIAEPYSEIENRFASTFSASNNTGTDVFEDLRTELNTLETPPEDDPPRRPSQDSVKSTPDDDDNESMGKRQVLRLTEVCEELSSDYHVSVSLLCEALLSGELCRRLHHRRRVAQYKVAKENKKFTPTEKK